VGLNISCKIVQKNPRLLTSLTISISQSNVLPLSKQRSPSLKARYFSPLFSSISIFLIISFSLCFLNFFFCGIFSLRVFFFFFSNHTELANHTQFSNLTLSISFKSHSFFFLALNFCFRYFLNFFFRSPPSEIFFFPNRTVFFFLTLRSYQLCFFLNFFFRSPLSDSFFFSKSQSFFFLTLKSDSFCFFLNFFVFILLSQSFFFIFLFLNHTVTASFLSQFLFSFSSFQILSCNTPNPLRLGLSPFFFYNKILQRSIRSIRVFDFSKSTINV
jgi:hypothetical protein